MLEQLTNPFCAFDAPSPTFDAEVNRSGGFTFSFWLKATGMNSLDAAGYFSPMLTIFSKVSPPRLRYSSFTASLFVT